MAGRAPPRARLGGCQSQRRACRKIVKNPAQVGLPETVLPLAGQVTFAQAGSCRSGAAGTLEPTGTLETDDHPQIYTDGFAFQSLGNSKGLTCDLLHSKQGSAAGCLTRPWQKAFYNIMAKGRPVLWLPAQPSFPDSCLSTSAFSAGEGQPGVLAVPSSFLCCRNIQSCGPFGTAVLELPAARSGPHSLPERGAWKANKQH